jgi:tRNA threonylcarbamoyladenosine biosynthesis protein TsaE
MGIREYLADGTLCLIEWPEKGLGVLPSADLIIQIDDLGDARQLNWQGNTERGIHWSEQLQKVLDEWQSK